MISRRALLGTGAGAAVVAGAAVYADRTHRLDDLARGLGLDPLPQPAAADRAILARARRDHSALLLSVRAVTQPVLVGALRPLAVNLRHQLEELGGPDPAARAPVLPDDAAALLAAVIAQVDTVRAARERDVVAAVSGEFAQVLAAIAVGLAQSLTVLRRPAPARAAA